MSQTQQQVEASRDLDPSTRWPCPALFTVDVRSIPGETVLALHGELDIATQELFASTLASVDETVPRIVLDLSDLSFIDCGNISLIHKMRILAGLRGTHLELRDPNPHLMRIFELTGLMTIGAAKGDGVRPNVLRMPSRGYDRPLFSSPSERPRSGEAAAGNTPC